MRRWLMHGVPMALLLFTANCEFTDDPPGTTGELGNGSFQYTCEALSDPACDVVSSEPVIPSQMAVGARFRVAYEAVEGGSTRVESAALSILSPAETFGEVFEGQRSGTVALMARRGEEYVDIIHVDIADVDKVQVDHIAPASDITDPAVTAITFQYGQTATLRAYPVDDAGRLLAGALPCAWTTADAGIVNIASDPEDNQVTLDALSQGQTTVQVELGDETLEIQVTVGQGTGGSGGGGAGGGGGGAGGSGGAVGGSGGGGGA